MAVNYSGGSNGKLLQTEEGIIYSYNSGRSSWEVIRGSLRPDVEQQQASAIESQLKEDIHAQALGQVKKLHILVDTAGVENPNVFKGEAFSSLSSALSWVSTTPGLFGLEVEISLAAGNYSWVGQHEYNVSELSSLTISSCSGVWFDYETNSGAVLASANAASLATAISRTTTSCRSVVTNNRYASKVTVSANSKLIVKGAKSLQLKGIWFEGAGVESTEPFLSVHNTKRLSLTSLLASDFNEKLFLHCDSIRQLEIKQCAYVGLGDQQLEVKANSVIVEQTLIGANSTAGKAALALECEKLSMNECCIAASRLGLTSSCTSAYIQNCKVIGCYQGCSLVKGNYYIADCLFSRNEFLGVSANTCAVLMVQCLLNSNGRAAHLYTCRTYLESCEIRSNAGWQSGPVMIVSSGRITFRATALESNTGGVVSPRGGVVINAAATTGNNSATTSLFTPGIASAGTFYNEIGAWRASNSN